MEPSPVAGSSPVLKRHIFTYSACATILNLHTVIVKERYPLSSKCGLEREADFWYK